MTTENYDLVHKRYQTLLDKIKTSNKQVTIVGASKQQSIEKIELLHSLGVNHFGENYLQEALDKKQRLTKQNINWHFIGDIQSNKCKLIAQNFDIVHSVPSIEKARLLNKHRVSNTPLDVFVQVNIDNESSKNGVLPELASDLCLQISELENINLLGLMVLPKPRIDQSTAEQRKPFALTRELLEQTNQRHGLSMNSLSMGMSNDFEYAILEGSTHIRIGSSLFGARA